jgi:transposase
MPIRWHPQPPIRRPDFQINGFPPLSHTANNRAIYRLRERVERLINRLKQNRRLATRYEKCAANYRAMWLIAATLLWL